MFMNLKYVHQCQKSLQILENVHEFKSYSGNWKKVHAFKSYHVIEKMFMHLINVCKFKNMCTNSKLILGFGKKFVNSTDVQELEKRVFKKIVHGVQKMFRNLRFSWIGIFILKHEQFCS